MKKTIHINIAGHAFSIDEDAYERLDAYLNAVEKKLGSSGEASETLEDINLRIAELFRSVHSDASSAITLSDVKEVINTLGDPGDYETPDDPETEKEEKTTFEVPPRRQLFRDPDNRVLGGVCGGLGNYFNINPLIFRLLFAVTTLFYGTSLLIYIILWIAIPKALTVQQRVMMLGSSASDSWRRRKTERSGSQEFFKGSLRVLGVILGIFLILVSFISLTGLIVTFSLSDIFSGNLLGDAAWIPRIDTLFLMPDQRLTAFLGISLTIGIPLLVLFYLGLHLVFRFKKGGSAFLVTALILWLAGIGLTVYTGVSVASGYAVSRNVDETSELAVPTSDTIYIDVNSSSLDLRKGKLIFNHEGLNVMDINNELTIIGTPDIDVNKGAETFSIFVRKQARGKSPGEALEDADKIEFFHLQNDSVLMIDRYFSIQSPVVMRTRRVYIDINIPEGKEVKVSDELKYLVDISE